MMLVKNNLHGTVQRMAIPMINQTARIRGIRMIAEIQQGYAAGTLRNMDWRLALRVEQIGFWSAIRQCRNLGMDFEDVYFMVFGRLPAF